MQLSINTSLIIQKPAAMVFEAIADPGQMKTILFLKAPAEWKPVQN